ncbi:SDR family NAD(P)-dependent oxidoreductase [Paenibacillus sp. TRM 82003]|nr:SDR family NAD(P)-dependent oxidoreductase [Paenibacillus sp. TRM 82003]
MKKRIVITGAGRGLGFELASAAADRGFEVLAGTRSGLPEGKLAELVRRLPGSVRVVELDATQEETVSRLAVSLRERGETVDAIVNNAAVLLGRGQSLEALDAGEVLASLDVNVVGPMRVAKHLAPLLKDGSASCLINVSSEAGSFRNAYGGDYAYATSKAALNFFTKQLRSALGERSVRVYAVHPGWIRTDMGGEAAPGDPSASAAGILDIVEGKTTFPDGAFFVDAQGGEMPL